MSSRIIRLITPNNQTFKIDIRGKENELIELISMISGTCKRDIKGLKDCYGNYYTISSAISNPNLNSEFSDVYFLICTIDSEFSPRHSQGYNSNGKSHGLNSISSPHYLKNFNSNCMRNPNRVQNFVYSSNNPNQFTRKNAQDEKYTKRNTVECENSREYVSDNYKINLKSETDYVNFYNRHNSENENYPEKIFCSPNNFLKKSSEKDAIYSIVKEIQKDNIFNLAQISKMNQLIKEENEDIVILLKVFSQKIIDKNSMVSGLNKIINKNICYKYSSEFIVQRKEKLNSYVDQLVQEFSKDNDDIILLKTLIEYENEFVMKAFDVYEEDRDVEKFKDSLQKVLQDRKRNSISFHTNNKSENDNGHFLDKKTQEKIISSLHTEERIIFKYALKNNFKEIELLSELFETFKKEEILIKPTKLLCKKFIEENVIQNLNDFQKTIFNELLTSRTQDLLEIFKRFKEHHKLGKLEKEILNLISKHDSRSSIETSKNSKDFSPKKRISSSEDSDNENSFVDKNKTENPKNYTKEFINLVNVMNFLKPEEKKEFEASINKNSLSALQLVNDYYKTNNIMSIKSSLLSMFRKNKNPLDSSIYFGEKTEKDKQKENEKEDTSSIIRPSNRKFKTSEATSKLDSFAKVLENLEKYQKISPDQRIKLFKRFENKDEKILSVWEVYKHNNNLNDLAESLFILSKKTRKEKSHFKLSHTPEILSKSKKDIQEFFKNKNIIDEKEELKIKQMNIIKILEKENFIDKERLVIIHQLIEDENHLLISAFEVLSVTKDHDEFCDTLTVICKNYKINELKNENSSQKIFLKSTDNKEVRLNQTFKDFIIHTENFNESEKNILFKLFSNKNEFILSALELFDKENDEIDFVDSLKIALKIKKN